MDGSPNSHVARGSSDDDQADRAGSAYLFHVSDWRPIPDGAPLASYLHLPVTPELRGLTTV